MRLTHLRTLHRKTPLGIDGAPEFSWRMESDTPDTLQTAYQIVVETDSGVLWDTGRVEGRAQSFIPYEGGPLPSGTSCSWTVTVWDNHGNAAESSDSFETALTGRDCWQARWIESGIPRPKNPEYRLGNQPPAVRFEKAFTLSAQPVRARLYATAYGVYRPMLNDQRLDDREFAPEYTVYRELLYYQTYDVTALLRQGENTFTMYVGDGWYLCPQCRPVMEDFHPMPAVLFQFVAEYADGGREIVCSDGSEMCRTGPVVYSDLFWGSKYDATLPFSQPQPVVLRDYGYDQLAAQPMPPVRPMAELPAVEVYTSPKGEVIVDFGQLVCGRARVWVDAPRGREITLSYFEQPDLDGSYLNTMFATQQDTYVSDGAPRLYESMFTFFGFRYVKVEGLDNVRKEDFTAVLLTTEKENTGFFRCSEPRLNRLYENIRWSQAGNMLSIPTDCPSREKAGFTGDIQIYAEAAMGNEDMTPFLTNYLRNLAAEQTEDGVVPMVVPHNHNYLNLTLNASKEFGDTTLTGVAGWGDAAVIVPYEMYRMTGNRLILERQFASMKAWCDYILRVAAQKRGGQPPEIDKWLWNTGFHFGEWLIPSQKDAGPGFEVCKLSSDYTAPMFGYRSVSLFAELCRVLGREKETALYQGAAEHMKKAIQRGLMADGRMPAELMGAYVLAIAFGLVPEGEMERFGRHLADMVEANGRRLDTGFLATPYLLDALVKIGREDLAQAVFWQDAQPSWLYEVDHGATAMWESWFNLRKGEKPGIVSFNHYAFGCVDSWIRGYLCGITPEEPGFRKIRIEPHPGRLKWLERRFVCEYGEIAVRAEGGKLTVAIPCNTTASVVWNGATHSVGSGTYTFT